MLAGADTFLAMQAGTLAHPGAIFTPHDRIVESASDSAREIAGRIRGRELRDALVSGGHVEAGKQKQERALHRVGWSYSGLEGSKVGLIWH